MEFKFKLGDKVVDKMGIKGVVVDFDEPNAEYPIGVLFEDEPDGVWWTKEENILKIS